MVRLAEKKMSGTKRKQEKKEKKIKSRYCSLFSIEEHRKITELKKLIFLFT